MISAAAADVAKMLEKGIAEDKVTDAIAKLANDDRFPFPKVPPSSVGMDQAKLEEAKTYALTGGGSGCILRNGQLVLSWGDQKRKYDIYSSTKSIGVTLLGLAIMDGEVQLHDKATKHLPSVGTPPEGNARTGWLDELTLWHPGQSNGRLREDTRLVSPGVPARHHMDVRRWRAQLAGGLQCCCQQGNNGGGPDQSVLGFAQTWSVP